ncbi:DNA-processing protein DprA [Rothia nasisuis]|uniref:DNA-processing protein DprA n=1 Tax=Rothia nasisuis TaxID=2109647 RepID=UPI001F032768|nr:DNA-processing protein DprA [Rothia nasisuis]
MTGSVNATSVQIQSSSTADLEDIRRARTEILRITDPEDAPTSALIQLVGPVLAADYLTGRAQLTSRVLAEHLEERGVQDLAGAQALSTTVSERNQRWVTRRGHITAEQDAQLARACDAWFCIPEDDDWPNSLNDLDTAGPVGIWGRGDRARLAQLNRALTVAVVGSRDVTSYGNSATSHLAGDLAAAGYTVISGGAFGVDATAHRAALATGVGDLSTVALMAGGLDRLYPKHNEQLLHSIIEQGLVLSEIPLGQNPTRFRFLQRNRLIAALSDSTVVVEARWRSGALNTANHALALGRSVYAVPGPIFSPTSEGCHRLIRDGLAQLTTDARHIIEDSAPLGNQNEQSLLSQPDTHQLLIDSLTEAQARVWDLLPVRTPVGADTLVAQVGLPGRTVMLTLSQLASLGLATTNRGGWAKTRMPADNPAVGR